jgi:outer membrane protein OmpA-like peptidoglycan-associated protein
MRLLLVGCSVLALTTAAAQAQTQTSPTTGDVGQSAQVNPTAYLVFFGFDEATLTPEGRQVVADAANAYQQSGSAVISVVGHTDTVGSESYNYDLGQRRAEAVAAELTRLGVPASAISTTSRGEQDLLVPTADEVREPQNRRVVIDVPTAPPPPVAAEPVAAAPPLEPQEEPGRFTFTVGGLYGHNFGEKDGDDGKTENDLAGVELTFDALPAFLGGLSLKQAALWSFNGVDDGLTGRTVASLNLMPLNLVVFRPFLSANFGGVYGEGVQDGLVAGPELGFDIGITDSTILRASVAYDYQFRNAGWDEGILWGGLNFGLRF